MLQPLTTVPMPPFWRTRSVAATETVNIPADLDLDSLYVKDLRHFLSQLNFPATGPRLTLVERLKEARQNEQGGSQSNVVTPPVKMAAITLNSSINVNSYNNRSKNCWTAALPTIDCCQRANWPKWSLWFTQHSMRPLNKQRPLPLKVQWTPSLGLPLHLHKLLPQR